MIRRTRFEFLAQFIRPKRAVASKPVREKRPLAKKKRWQYAAPLPGVCGTVMAHTRSEARSEIKKRHDMKGRVPIGTLITQSQ